MPNLVFEGLLAYALGRAKIDLVDDYGLTIDACHLPHVVTL